MDVFFGRGNLGQNGLSSVLESIDLQNFPELLIAMLIFLGGPIVLVGRFGGAFPFFAVAPAIFPLVLLPLLVRVRVVEGVEGFLGQGTLERREVGTFRLFNDCVPKSLHYRVSSMPRARV